MFSVVIFSALRSWNVFDCVERYNFFAEQIIDNQIVAAFNYGFAGDKRPYRAISNETMLIIQENIKEALGNVSGDIVAQIAAIIPIIPKISNGI